MGKAGKIATLACFVALVAGQVNARNHISNCLTDEDYAWHENNLSLICFIKANEDTGLIDYYSGADIGTKTEQGRGPWIQVHATQIVSSQDGQYLFGSASDYNGNNAAARIVKSDGTVKIQNSSYFLVTDAECELRPAGFMTPNKELDPAELCRIKNQ